MIRVLVTMPVDLPISCAHFIMEVSRFDSIFALAQSEMFTVAVTPIARKLVFTPVRNAVAVHAESATWLFTQYV